MTNLTTFKINGTTPFYSLPDNADEALGQAHALLIMFSGAEQVCEAVSESDGDAYENIRNGIQARALDGIATLVAFAQFNLDAARKAPEAGKWGELLSAYQTAKARLDEHGTVIDTSKCGSPENIAHEAVTERLANAHADAFDALMLEPAPHRKALAFKTAAFSQVAGNDAWHRGGEILAQIAADAERLEA